MHRSPRGQSAASRTSASFSEGTDSPVREASWTLRFAASTRRRSAGTMSPSRRKTMSPGTSSLAGRMLSSPSRRTRAVGARMFRRASREDWAFFSWTMPMTALTTTMVPMTMASVHSCSRAENRAAPMRMRTIGSSSCSFSMRRMDLGGFARSVLGPWVCRRSVASASRRPSSEE